MNNAVLIVRQGTSLHPHVDVFTPNSLTGGSSFVVYSMFPTYTESSSLPAFGANKKWRRDAENGFRVEIVSAAQKESRTVTLYEESNVSQRLVVTTLVASLHCI